MKANYCLKVVLLVLWGSCFQAARANTEFFLSLPVAGEYTVQLANQSITLSNSRYRFFDLVPGQCRLTILRNGFTVCQDWVELRANSRTVGEYSPSRGLRILTTLALYGQQRSSEVGWYEPEGSRSVGWQAQANRGVDLSSRLTAEDFDRLRQALTKEPFDDRRMELVRVALPGRMLSTSQLIVLLRSFTFDKQRLEAAKLEWNSVTDQQNFYQVFDTFTFSAGVTELKAFLAAN